MTDTEKNPSLDLAVKLKRLYAVKLVIDDFYRPNSSNAQGDVDTLLNTWRVMAVFAPAGNPPAMTEFGAIVTTENVNNLKANSPVKVRTFLVARMDSQKG